MMNGTTNGTSDACRVVWPSSRFFWSVLDPSGSGSSPESASRRSRPTREYLDSLFEEDLPLAIDLVHAAYAPTDDGRYLACGVTREALDDLPEGAISLKPESIAPALGLDASCDLLELLRGEYEPRVLKRERNRRGLIAIAAMLIGAALMTTGILRRATSAANLARGFDASSLALVRSILPESTGDLSTAPWNLKQELASLRVVRSVEASGVRSPDATLALADVLLGLPKATSLRTDVLAVTPGIITLNFATDADPQAVLKGLSAPSGWTLDQPRMTSNGSTTSLAIQMRRGGRP